MRVSWRSIDTPCWFQKAAPSSVMVVAVGMKLLQGMIVKVSFPMLLILLLLLQVNITSTIQK
jgi:hypothetical protein